MNIKYLGLLNMMENLTFLKQFIINLKQFYLKFLGFHLSTYSNPVGSGLGGSSTLVVSIITAFIKLYKLSLNKYQIAKLFN